MTKIPVRITIVASLLLPLAGLASHPLFSKNNQPRQTVAAFSCGTSAGRQVDALARGKYHESLMQRQLARRGGPRALVGAIAAPSQADAGNIAIIQDDGTLIEVANPFNVPNRSFRFEPGNGSTYAVVPSATLFAAGEGTNVSLADDDSKEITLGFGFTFYGRIYPSVLVNSDGNLTFLAPDTASTSRDLGRFSSGPPRIGPLFTDLDPTAGGVRFRQDPDGTIFIWDNVPRFDTRNSNNFSVKLFRDGKIEFAYGRIDTGDAVAGISPGSSIGGISAVDFAQGLPVSGLPGTIAEVFASQTQIIETAIARKFLQTHPDEFDQLIIFLAFPFYLQGAFAYELNVKNDAKGIGLPEFDDSNAYGSKSRLKSFVMMGSLDGNTPYPSDPTVKFFRTYNSLEVLAHEVGHRWLAFSDLLHSQSEPPVILWPTDLAHWSFFFNANASVMEGNQISDRGASFGDRRFVTVAATDRYGLLDRYLMGLESEQDVPGMFYVANPTGTSRIQSSFPSVDVTFGGTRKDFSVGDIIAANGQRDPTSSQTLKVHRQAFILLTRAGEQASAEQIAKLQNLHDAWVPYFTEQTGSQGWVVTNLQSSPGTTPRTILFPYFHGDSQWYTGLALANWGTTPVDVRFTAYDDSGSPLSQPAGFVNRRVVTIPPQAQVALLDAQVFDVSVNDPREGWAVAESSSSQITGFFLEGDIAQTRLDGAVAGNEPSSTLYFTRAQLGGDPFPAQTRRNVIDVINPGDTGALLTLRLMNQSGQVRGTIQRSLNPKGRLMEEVASLFPDSSLPPFRGYIALTSDVGVVGYQADERDSTLMSLAAQPPTAAGVLYSAQFASGRAGNDAYFTELNLINTSVEPRTVQVQLIANSGLPVVGIANPFTTTIQPGAQFIARGETLFSLPDAAMSLILVEGSLVISAGGPGVIGDVSFGDPVRGRFLASLPLDARPASNMVLSQVAQGSTGQGKPYFTGVALYNPNATDVNINVEVYSENGRKTGSAAIPLPGGNRVSKTLPELVPAITEQIRGYIRVTSIGGPVVGYGLFGTQSLDFLAAVPPQPIIP